MTGAHDMDVDVAATALLYRSVLGGQFTTTTFDVAHSMVRKIMEDSELTGFITGVLWPGALLSPGVIEDYRAFLDGL